MNTYRVEMVTATAEKWDLGPIEAESMIAAGQAARSCLRDQGIEFASVVVTRWT